MKRYMVWGAYALLVLLFTACGGGGSKTSSGDGSGGDVNVSDDTNTTLVWDEGKWDDKKWE